MRRTPPPPALPLHVPHCAARHAPYQREWIDAQEPGPMDLARWPEHLYENFFVVVGGSTGAATRAASVHLNAGAANASSKYG